MSSEIRYQDYDGINPKFRLIALLFGPAMDYFEKNGISGAFLFPPLFGLYLWFVIRQKKKESNRLGFYEKFCIGVFIFMILFAIAGQILKNINGW